MEAGRLVRATATVSGEVKGMHTRLPKGLDRRARDARGTFDRRDATVPIARASFAAQMRRDRSVNTGASAACFDRNMANCTHHRTMPDQAVQPILFSYLLTCP